MAGYINKNFSGNTLENTKALENYQDSINVNVYTTPNQLNEMASKYYSTLENYLNPSTEQLQMCQNISSLPIRPNGSSGGPPGQANSYSNCAGDGYMDNLGYLGQNAYPPVAYGDDRSSEISNCAKNLPMFAASTLLPKPSTNADNIGLSQDAARALSAFTALSPVEQIGGITSIKTPYSKITDLRAIDPIGQGKMVDVPFGAASAYGTTPTFGNGNNGFFQYSLPSASPGNSRASCNF